MASRAQCVQLPLDVWGQVAEFLDELSAARLAATSKELHAAVAGRVRADIARDKQVQRWAWS